MSSTTKKPAPKTVEPLGGPEATSKGLEGTDPTPSTRKGKGGKKGRSGPTRGNLNSTRNGTKLTRLTLGELPKTMRRQTQNCRKYRRDLEDLVLSIRVAITPTDAHLIDEATTAEVHASVCRWLLRTRIDTMTVSDITRCSEQIVKATTARNKAVERLNLDTPPPSPWETTSNGDPT